MEKIIFTNGCFDVMHIGHINLLNFAKRQGDKLIVGINSDSSIKRLKGKNRPINNQSDRKYLLENIKAVDEVHIFTEDTPYNLIKSIMPDIIVKGSDYNPINVVGNDLADVICFPIIPGYSTTNIIKKTNIN
jgi:rfaE bifunctional protein nucleotidyltransferase chain/domain